MPRTLTAIMVQAVGSDSALAEFLSDERRNAVLIGPGAGVGAGTAANVLTVLAAPPPPCSMPMR